ncbi:MAG: O-antigen ligase family protein [Coxiellaceae bacterium]|nr:O-antigen ligase family protein [Coxiellaceae bacterium]
METNLNRYQQIMSTVAGCSAVVTFFVLSISTSATTILFALSALLVLLSGVYVTQVRRWLLNPVTLCFVAYYAVVLIGAIYSIGLMHDISKALLKQVRVIEALLLLPIFFQPRWRQWAINAFLLAMVVTLILSFVHYYIWPYAQRANLAPASAFKDNIVQSYLFAIAIGILLNKVIKADGWLRWGLVILIALLLFDNFAMSLSRTGYVVTAVVLLYWAYTQLPTRRFWMALVGLVLILFGVFGASSNFQARIIDAFSNSEQYHKHQQADTETSAGQRLEMLKRGWYMYTKRPVVGFGTGSFLQANQRYNVAHPKQPAVSFSSTNNIYLNAAVHYGVIGLVLLFIFLSVLWVYARHLSVDERYIMRIILLCLIVGGLFNPWFADTTPSHAFVLLAVLAYGGYRPRAGLD